MPGSSRPSRNSSEAPPPVDDVGHLRRRGPAARAPRPSRRHPRRPSRRVSAWLGEVARRWPSCRGRTTGSRRRPAARSRTRSSPSARASSIAVRGCLAEVDDVPRRRELLGADASCTPVPRVTSLAITTSIGRMTGTPCWPRPRRGSAGRPRRDRARPGSCRRSCPGRAGTCWPSRRRGRGCRPWSARCSMTPDLVRRPSRRRGSPRTAAPGSRAAWTSMLDLALHQQPGVGRQELAMPTVEAWARWAVPNASLT